MTETRRNRQKARHRAPGPPLVTNMVCPRCGQLHGREHADGCPDGENARQGYYRHDSTYAAGWDAAQVHFSAKILAARAEGQRRLVHGLRHLHIDEPMVADFIAMIADTIERRW